MIHFLLLLDRVFNPVHLREAFLSTSIDIFKTLPVTISVPVNLRGQYGTESYGNFFTMMDVVYNFAEQPTGLDAILQHVHTSFLAQVQPANLRQSFSQFVAIERNMAVRGIPVLLKDIVLRISKWRSGRFVTSILSNLGRVQMPDAMKPFIQFFDFYDRSDSLKVCMVSFEDNLCINFTGKPSSNAVPRTFFKALVRMDVPVELTSNTRSIL